MSGGYLLDEHLPKWWRRELMRRGPDFTVWRVGDPEAPPRRSPDPDLLLWCEAHKLFLVTNNRKSLPEHLAEHVAQGHHVPGIFMGDPKYNIRELCEELILIYGASFENECRDQIRHLPVS